ncbi:hypothetical protein B0A48_08223 [Cryoendolithus antarcticus]|uniref:Major facilitator superfamily (MFS) profile domain-containing protein n=1 Tax=Cryoendolithus antarcticus TaxID=1507870 RepID=A0A1V8T513_9PEZI|nr:hypothetical protein B0A48_08223 [Cryoendolithus antarcticus]
MLCCGRRTRRDPDTPPFPVRQMFVLALCRLAEPIAFMSIFPYVYHMIESFHTTSDDRRITFYAGMVTSAFAFAEFLSCMVWGRVSDRYGRKPILLTGLAGTGISMILFGFAPNLTTALIARAMGGLLNGNIGVLQSTVAEVITVEAHQPYAYSVMPIVWCLGSVAGSAIGGVMADPVRNYGWAEGSIWDKFPFLLPNVFCTAVVVLAMFVGILFLEETHEEKKLERDRGLELGKRILSIFQRESMAPLSSTKTAHASTTYTLIREESFDSPPDYRSTAPSPELVPTHSPEGLPPPAYQSIEGSPRSSISREDSRMMSQELDPEALVKETEAAKRNASTLNAFTKQVIIIIVSYGILAYHTISAEQLLPVMFTLPESTEPVSLPFGFTGGFGLPTKSIGGILSVQGVVQVIAMLFAFPPLTKRLGSLTLFRVSVFTYPFLYIITPYLTLAPISIRMPCVYIILMWKVCAQAFTFPSALVMIANNTPSSKVSGTLNGAMGAAASLSRTFGPPVSGQLQGTGLAHGVLGLPWWANACVAVGGAFLSIFMIEERRRTFASEKHAAVHEESDDMLLIVESPNASLETMQSTPSSPILTRFDRRSSRS